MFGWFKKPSGMSRKPETAHTGADIAAEFMARAGWEEPVAPTPGWALLLRSPYDTSKVVTSWLGGIPHAPTDFSWPMDTDGKPLHFIAQIDLASLQPEPETGLRPPGLPEQGALLVFVGRSYACPVLSVADMGRAVPLSLPDQLEPIRKHGFFSDKPVFSYWPIDPVAFLDTGSGRPPFLPDPFEHPRNWIINWGIAALEAEIVIESLERELGFGRDFLARLQGNGDGQAKNRVIESKTAYYTVMARSAPPVVSAMKAWREAALSKPPEALIDQAQVDEVFTARRILHDKIEENYPPKSLLLGRAKAFWEKLCLSYSQENDFSLVPMALQPFVAMWLTDWRGHRLFGLEPPFPNNGEDRRGQDCLISVAADRVLNTDSEHEYGMSIWCPKQRLMKGQFEPGQFIRHIAV
ncbi:DUF1963 domain-containing protein [Rhodopseudomonas palustris]